MKTLRYNAGDTDAGGFDGENLVDGAVRKQTPEFLTHLIEQFHIHLVVQKGIHL